MGCLMQSWCLDGAGLVELAGACGVDVVSAAAGSRAPRFDGDRDTFRVHHGQHLFGLRGLWAAFCSAWFLHEEGLVELAGACGVDVVSAAAGSRAPRFDGNTLTGYTGQRISTVRFVNLGLGGLSAFLGRQSRAWFQLRLDSGRCCSLIITAHHVGCNFSNFLLAARAATIHRTKC
jgi:hypothetical protein